MIVMMEFRHSPNISVSFMPEGMSIFFNGDISFLSELGESNHTHKFFRPVNYYHIDSVNPPSLGTELVLPIFYAQGEKMTTFHEKREID